MILSKIAKNIWTLIVRKPKSKLNKIVRKEKSIASRFRFCDVLQITAIARVQLSITIVDFKTAKAKNFVWKQAVQT